MLNARGAQGQLLVMRKAEGFFDSVVLFAIADLGITALLRDGPMTAAALHERVGGDRALLTALLDAAVALNILAMGPHGYEAPEHLILCLADPGASESLLDWLTFLQSCVGPLATLSHGVRTGVKPLELLTHQSGTASSSMSAAMHAYARSRAAELPRFIGLAGVRSLLDLGSGPGTYSLAILDAAPQARATLVDGPEAIAMAKRLAADRALLSRADFVVADLFAFEVRGHFDLVLVSNVLHMIGPELARSLLARAFQLTAAGGRIVVQAQYLDEEKQSPRWPVLLNLLQAAGTAHGRNHSVSDTKSWLEEAGYSGASHVPLSIWNVNSCVVAQKTG